MKRRHTPTFWNNFGAVLKEGHLRGASNIKRHAAEAGALPLDS